MFLYRNAQKAKTRRKHTDCSGNTSRTVYWDEVGTGDAQGG